MCKLCGHVYKEHPRATASKNNPNLHKHLRGHVIKALRAMEDAAANPTLDTYF